MDDMCENNDNGQEHIISLRYHFQTIKDACWKGSKIDIDFKEILFLGHNFFSWLWRRETSEVTRYPVLGKIMLELRVRKCSSR